MRKHVINKVYTGDLNSLEDIKQGELIIDNTFNNELISFKNDRGLFVSVETKTLIDKKINTKQNITDELLQTETKEIVPAINEVLNVINTVQDTLEETKKELSANISSINNTIDSINQDIQQNTNKINNVNTDLSSQITTMNTELTENINDVNTDLTSQISSVNTELTEYINTVNSELTSQISSVNTYVIEVTSELTTNVNNLDESTTESFTEVNKNIEDINIELNKKQDKKDSSLNTEDKTIVGAINELKDDIVVLSSSDLLDLSNRIDGVANDVTNNTDNINFLLDTKQDKEDSGLETNSNTIVGAINEVNSKIPDISNLAKQSDLNELKEKVNTNTTNISNLTTNVNTNTNSINTINSTLSTLAKQSDLTNLSNKVTTNTNNISTNTNNISSLTTKVNTNTSDITNLKNNKQEKSDNSLNTNNKTVIGGINELKTKIDNIDTELDKKQDKEDNNLQTDTKTVVGAINELDSKLKAEEFAGGLKVKLVNNGTAIITNEGISVLDSNNVEKIKLVDRNVNLTDFAGNKYEKQEQPEFNSFTHVNNGSVSSTSKYEIPSNSYDSLSVSIVGNINIYSPSLGNLSKDYPKYYYFYIYIGNDRFTINIGIKKYEGDTNYAMVDTVSSDNNKCIVSKVDDKNISFKIENYSPSNINNKHEITYSVNTSYSSDNIAMSFNVTHKNNGYIKYVGTLKPIETNPKTIIGFNGFLNYYNPNGYFGAYHDGTNYQIVGKGKNGITYI